MKKIIILFAFLQAAMVDVAQVSKMPAYPLITHDPYFSIWSFSDQATASNTRHWTGREQAILITAKIDGSIYQLMGKKENESNSSAIQQSLNVTATSTQYVFRCGETTIGIHFLSPLLASDLNLLSRPLSYIDFSVKSMDGKNHQVDVVVKISSDIAVNEKSEPVSFSSGQHQIIRYVKAGSNEQKILGKKGDNVRINWGYGYLASADKQTLLRNSSSYMEASFILSTGGSLHLLILSCLPMMTFIRLNILVKD